MHVRREMIGLIEIIRILHVFDLDLRQLWHALKKISGSNFHKTNWNNKD